MAKWFHNSNCTAMLAEDDCVGAWELDRLHARLRAMLHARLHAAA